MTEPLARDCRKAQVLVVDDHPLVRDSLVLLINGQRDLICCAEAGSAPEALAAAVKHRPDLVIMDLRLKAGDGLELIKSCKSQLPDVRILVFSHHGEQCYVERALCAGALGYVVKDQAAEAVVDAMRTVLAGRVYVTHAMATSLLHKLTHWPPKGDGDNIGQLTDRELHVLQLLGAGMSTREIAAELCLSFKTIESHRENLKHKLELHGAAELLHYATQWAGEKTPIPPAQVKNPVPPPGS